MDAPKKILLVDDTKTVLFFEEMCLKGLGHIIKTAADGQIALDLVEKEYFDLILLDIMMPNVDGIETCRRLKSDIRYSKIPIITVTTKGNEDMMEQASKAGCNDYLTKPINKMLLVSKVEQYLKGA